MKFRQTFPPHPAFGHCLVNGQISEGPCVDLRISTDVFTRNRHPETLVLAADTVQQMAAHFGMVAADVHEKAVAELTDLADTITEQEAKIEALLGTLQAFGLPEPAPAPAKKAAAKKAAAKG